MDHDLEKEFMKQGELHVGDQAVETLNTIQVGFGNGSISIEKRIEAHELTRDRVESLKTDILTNPSKFLKPVRFPISLSCGDGRPGDEDDDGLKVFGGLLFFVNVDQLTNNVAKVAGNFLDRIPFVSKKLISADLLPGGHIDDHAHGSNCGCGAMDKKAESHSGLQAFAPEIKDFTAKLLGKLDLSYEEELADQILVKNRQVGDVPSGVDQLRALQDVIYEMGQGRIEKLHGAHKEGLIVVNLRPGYTVARELINQYTERQLQVFATDVEAITRGADALYRRDEDKLRFVHGSVMWTGAVTATLTDGLFDIVFVE